MSWFEPCLTAFRRMLKSFGLRPGLASKEAVEISTSSGAEHADSDWDAFESFSNFTLHGTGGGGEKGGGKRLMQRVGLGTSQPGFFSSIFGLGGGTKASSSDYELVRTQLDGLSGISPLDDDDDLLF